MRKVLLVGHFTKDIIDVEGRVYNSLGGPPLYAGLLLSRSRYKPVVLTRVGTDYPEEMLSLLRGRGVEFHDNPVTQKPTTCFLLKVVGGDFKPYLRSRCSDITTGSGPSPDPDAVILNPVAREVDLSLAMECRRDSEVVYVDPQGFLREWDDTGSIRLARSEVFLGVLRLSNAVKMDVEEARVATGADELEEAVKRVMRMGVEYFILTRGPTTRLYTPGHAYEYAGRSLKFADAVGLGDLLGGGFVAGLLEGDPVWGLALGISAATIRPGEKGINKVADWGLVEKRASEIYGGIKRLY